MTVNDLSKMLELFYNEGTKRKETNAFIQMFGIKYARIILENNIKIDDIVENSLLKGTTYSTEIRKAIKLQKYVILREDLLF